MITGHLKDRLIHGFGQWLLGVAASALFWGVFPTTSWWKSFVPSVVSSAAKIGAAFAVRPIVRGYERIRGRAKT